MIILGIRVYVTVGEEVIDNSLVIALTGHMQEVVRSEVMSVYCSSQKYTGRVAMVKHPFLTFTHLFYCEFHTHLCMRNSTSDYSGVTLVFQQWILLVINNS